MVAVGENMSVGYWSWQNKENLWATWHAGQISLLDPRLMFLPSLQTDQSQSQRLATLSALQILLLALNYPTRPLSTCSRSNKTLFSSTVGKKDLQPENKKSFSCSVFNQPKHSSCLSVCHSLSFPHFHTSEPPFPQLHHSQNRPLSSCSRLHGVPLFPEGVRKTTRLLSCVLNVTEVIKGWSHWAAEEI